MINTKKNISKFLVLFTTMLLSFSFVFSQNINNSPNKIISDHEINTTLIDSLNKNAFSIFRTNPLKTKELALISLEYSKLINYKKGEGKANNYIGMTFHITGEYDSAKVYYEKSLSIFELLPDKTNIGKILNNLALLFSHQEYYNLALEYNFKSLEIANDLNNIKSKLNSYNNIGITYEKLEKYDKSIEFYQKGLDLLKSTDDFTDSGFYYYALGNIGIINIYKCNFDMAAKYIKESLEYFKQINDNYGISQGYGYLSELYIKTNKADSAIQTLAISNKYAEIIGDKKLLATNQFHEAKLDFQLKKYISAKGKFEKVLKLARSNKFSNIEMESYFFISKIDSVEKNYLSALQNHQAGVVLRDSLNSTIVLKQIAELTIQYETLQKDQEIALLKQNKEIQELTIKKQLSQRNLLIVTLIAVIGFIGVIIYSLWKTRVKNNLLAIQNKKIATKNAELFTHHERLENLVLERTAELLKSKEKAEESDRLKSAFLANMSHEIRTPMNGILGFTRLLKKPQLSGEEQAKYISIIEKSGNRLLNTINDLIDISKIEADQMEVQISKANINDKMEDLYNFFKPQFDEKGIRLSFTNALSTEKANINTDGEKLYAILTNLIKNAIKYTHKGSIEFGYNIKDNDLEFYVKDTGIGIPSDRKEAVFDRFIQADIEDKNVYEGSGLGLSISQAYVEMLGGKMWVESEKGVGSQFYFTIPYNVDTETISKSKEKPEVTGEHSDKKLKILIVEDEETAELYLSIVLKNIGKEILHATTGIEAIDICRKNPDIDLIMMDIKMPEMDGYEATRKIREFNKDVIIIAQTAYALMGDRKKSLEAGCDDYISKPIDPTLLTELIKAHCIEGK